MSGLKLLKTARGLAEAEIIRSLLASHQIPCVFRSDVVQAVYPFTVNGLGDVQICVAEEEYESAHDLLNSLFFSLD